MSKEVHIAILEPKMVSFRRPEERCLQLGIPMELKKALEVAGRYTELLTQLKELIFIEEEGVKATKELQCGPCNNRSSERQDFEYLISELSPKTR